MTRHSGFRWLSAVVKGRGPWWRLHCYRRFIILDLYQTTPSLIAALAGAAFALGIVFWLVTNREGPQEVEAQERFFEPDHLE